MDDPRTDPRPLPPGFEMKQVPSGGRMRWCFINHQTASTSWTDPRGPRPRRYSTGAAANVQANAGGNAKSASVVTKIDVWYGGFVNKIRFSFSDGLAKDFGRSTGKDWGTFAVPEGEYVAEVRCNTNANLIAVQFVTDAGTCSKVFGNSSSTLSTVYSARSGQAIVGLQRADTATSGITGIVERELPRAAAAAHVNHFRRDVVDSGSNYNAAPPKKVLPGQLAVFDCTENLEARVAEGVRAVIEPGVMLYRVMLGRSPYDPEPRIEAYSSATTLPEAVQSSSYFDIKLFFNQPTRANMLRFEVGCGLTEGVRGYSLRTSVDDFATVVKAEELDEDVIGKARTYPRTVVLPSQMLDSLTLRFHIYCPGPGGSVDFRRIIIDQTGEVAKQGGDAIGQRVSDLSSAGIDWTKPVFFDVGGFSVPIAGVRMGFPQCYPQLN